MNAGARRLIIFGTVVVLAIALGVVARREVQRWNTAAPQVATTPQVVPEGSEPSGMAAAPAEGSAEASKPAAAVPSFDVVRVEPSGEAVVAGRAAPGTDVELLANGGVLDRTKANEVGEFVMMPPALPTGSHELTLRTPDGGGVGSRQAVTVAMPAPGKGDVLVVIGEAGKPSRVVQAGKPEGVTAGTVAAPGPPPRAADTSVPLVPLRIGAVEAEGGRLFVQGSGPAGARVLIYLNDAPLAEAVVGGDSRWSLTVEKGLSPGEYKVRVDRVGENGKVLARAEVPFAQTPASAAAPSAVASAPEPARTAAAPEPKLSAPAPAPAAPPPDPAATASVAPNGDTANPVLSSLDTLEVKRGDNLWRISRRVYGRGIRYSTIYEANTDQIRDPDRIYPGQIFVMPPRT